MGGRDYYAILGVARDAEDEVISAAYKALMKKYHPDKFSGSDAERARLINEAYEVLKNPAKRRAYDSARAQGGAEQSRSQSAKTDTPPPGPQPSHSSNTVHAEPQAVDPSERNSWGVGIFIVIVVGLFGGAAYLINLNAAESGVASVEDVMSADNVTEMTAEETEPAASSLADIDAPALDFANIEKGATEFLRILEKSGMQGARRYSEQCHDVVRSKPDWNGADFCASFDHAASFVDEGVSKVAGIAPRPYFQFQRENSERNYLEAGAPAYSAPSRLADIRRISERVVYQEIDDRRIQELVLKEDEASGAVTGSSTDGAGSADTQADLSIDTM